MKIQVYFNRDNYLPFFLYVQSITSIIKQHITQNIEIINNYNLINNNKDTLLILFLLDLNTFINIQNITNIQKIILINTEFYKNYNTEYTQYFTILNHSTKYYIWDFSSSNIMLFNTYYPNINMYYLPLLYNQYLEDYYNNIISKKIDYNNKQIDILFFGTMNMRRKIILDKLTKYNVKIICIEDNLTNQQLFNYIENSKIILNIYYYTEYVFDYYRIALLISNKVLVINESPKNIDILIEKNLINWEQNIIHEDYSNLISKIENTLENTTNEKMDCVNKTYDWFTQNSMDKYIVNFFNSSFFQ